MSERHEIIPVWFFVGVLLLVYGVMILISGLCGVVAPAGHGAGRIARAGMVGWNSDGAWGNLLCDVPAEENLATSFC